MLTVVTWLWDGWRPLYNAGNVNAMQRMLQQFLKVPYRMVCVTDSPKGINCETIPLWSDPHVITQPNKPNCYKRLKLFSADAREVFGDRVLSIDLDCLILRDISHLITDHDFRVVSGVSCPYNGSMWLLRTGTRTHVWDNFHATRSPEALETHRTPEGKRILGSDQAWMHYTMPAEATWKNSDGVYLFQGKLKSIDILRPARVIFFPGHRKPWHHAMERKFKPIYDAYRQFL